MIIKGVFTHWQQRDQHKRRETIKEKRKEDLTASLKLFVIVSALRAAAFSDRGATDDGSEKEEKRIGEECQRFFFYSQVVDLVVVSVELREESGSVSWKDSH